MKLFYAPGACSIGIHVILEEIGKPFELHKIDLRGGEQFKPPMSEINPKSKVPTLLRDNGRVVTEFPVIAHYLAEQNPEAALLPSDPEHALEAAEALDYCVATIHMQGFSRLFRPSNFAPSETDHDAVKARGKEIIDKGYGIMARQLDGREWVGGTYSVADAALFYVEFWGAKRMGMTLPANLAAHFERMMARPAVQRTMATEGFA
jgi:glutathione S-transferase